MMEEYVQATKVTDCGRRNKTLLLPRKMRVELIVRAAVMQAGI